MNLNLSQFTGTENWYRHPLVRKVLYTDGAKYVADKCEAYWLLDAIASWQLDPKVKDEPFQVWKLTTKDSTGVLVCEDGNGHEVTRQEISYTDFPLDEITLWFTDNVILLPSEY